MIVRSRLLLPVAAIALAFAFAMPAAFADDMSKDNMSKDSGMKKDSMSKDQMSKDSMSKDSMSEGARCWKLLDRHYLPLGPNRSNRCP